MHYTVTDARHVKNYTLWLRFADGTEGDVCLSEEVFDNRRRSTALIQIAGAVTRGIMKDEELSSFSEETQERVRRILAI